MSYSISERCWPLTGKIQGSETCNSEAKRGVSYYTPADRFGIASPSGFFDDLLQGVGLECDGQVGVQQVPGG